MSHDVGVNETGNALNARLSDALRGASEAPAADRILAESFWKTRPETPARVIPIHPSRRP